MILLLTAGCGKKETLAYDQQTITQITEFMIDYSPFWKTLKETGVTQYDLIYHHNISRGTIHRMRKNKPLTLVTVDILCSILEVPIEKIVCIRPADSDCETSL